MNKKYLEAKTRKELRKNMTLEERKEMCEAYHGTWVHSYRKGNVEVAGYCRKKGTKEFWK